MTTTYNPSDYAALLADIPASSIYIGGKFEATSDRIAVFGKADGAHIMDCGAATLAHV